MDIAAMSTSMSMASIQQSASISVTKKAMDSTEMIAQQMLEMLPQQPGLGEHINVLA